jgi:hypothetical protein
VTAVAASNRERVADAATDTTGEVMAPHRPQGSSQSATLSQAERARQAGVSKRTQEKLDALARKAPEKLQLVREGKLSAHRACVEAGIVKEPTGLQLLRRALRKAPRRAQSNREVGRPLRPQKAPEGTAREAAVRRGVRLEGRGKPCGPPEGAVPVAL